MFRVECADSLSDRVPMKISESKELYSQLNDFGAEVSQKELLVPKNVYKIFTRLDIKTAEDLLDFTHSFPSLLAEELGWGPQQVTVARKKLVGLLHGYLPETLLKDYPAPQKGFGARDPRDLRGC